jgi:hypothetical protein
MEQLEFLLNWPFWVGLVAGVVVGPHILKLVSKLKK